MFVIFQWITGRFFVPGRLSGRRKKGRRHEPEIRIDLIDHELEGDEVGR